MTSPLLAKTSAKLTVFEGPDGSGKTTAAQAFAELTGAKYVHFPSLPLVGQGLARMYVEAMMPALLGYQDVVFDRCWLSETPYGMAFRNGQLRLNAAHHRMLSRLALRCGAVVVRCLPAWEVVRDNYLSRKNLEMLENEDQLHEVYNIYKMQVAGLPSVKYDYTTLKTSIVNPFMLDTFRTIRHPLAVQSAGDWWAGTVLIGQAFGERNDHDPWYQWPFASFSNGGCSQWLTETLEGYGVKESQLLWFNADQDLATIFNECPYLHNRTVIALGAEAHDKLGSVGVKSRKVPHPQYWKRFHGEKPYELLEVITRSRRFA